MLKDQVRLFYNTLPEKDHVDVIQISSEVVCLPNSVNLLKKIVNERLREGGIAVIGFIGHYLGLLIKESREYLDQVTIFYV